MRKGLCLILAVAILIIPSKVFGISGACSSHGGVNCSAGANLEGNVVCNDGWANSSVLFSQTDECNCPLPVSYGCKTENDYGALLNSNITSGQQEFMNQISSGSLKACRDQITKYQADLLTYNKCLANSQPQQSYTNSNNNLKQLETDFISSMNATCKSSLGVNGYYDFNQKSCFCNKGYISGMQGASLKCILPADYCKQVLGENSHPVMEKFSLPINIKNRGSATENCACDSGYILTSGKCLIASILSNFNNNVSNSQSNVEPSTVNAPSLKQTAEPVVKNITINTPKPEIISQPNKPKIDKAPIIGSATENISIPTSSTTIIAPNVSPEKKSKIRSLINGIINFFKKIKF